jgi:hypothetical protein
MTQWKSAWLLWGVCAVGALSANAGSSNEPPARLGAESAPPVVTPADPAAAPAPAAPAVTMTPAPTPAVETPAPVVVPAALDSVRIDLAADQAFKTCVTTMKDDAQGRACLKAIVTSSPNSTAALRAQAGLDVLDAKALAEKPFFAPGRLELSSTVGAFGLWNGIALGVSVFTVAPALAGNNGGVMILGTGVASLALGAAGAVGGYYLADAFKLDEGGSRMVSSGLIWGTVVGTALTPVVLDVLAHSGVQNGQLLLPATLGTVVLAGYAGGAGAIAAATSLHPTAGQVSIVNTGGWIGGTVGLLALADLAAFSAPNVEAYSFTFIGAEALGLGAGILAASQLKEISWGETLVIDLGAAAGGLALGTAGVGVWALAGGSGDAHIVTPILTGLPVLGLVGGAVAAGAGVLWARANGKGGDDSKAPALRVSMGVPTLALDSHQQVVTMMPLLAASW